MIQHESHVHLRRCLRRDRRRHVVHAMTSICKGCHLHSRLSTIQSCSQVGRYLRYSCVTLRLVNNKAAQKKIHQRRLTK